MKQSKKLELIKFRPYAKADLGICTRHVRDCHYRADCVAAMRKPNGAGVSPPIKVDVLYTISSPRLIIPSSDNSFGGLLCTHYISS